MNRMVRNSVVIIALCVTPIVFAAERDDSSVHIHTQEGRTYQYTSTTGSPIKIIEQKFKNGLYTRKWINKTTHASIIFKDQSDSLQSVMRQAKKTE